MTFIKRSTLTFLLLSVLNVAQAGVIEFNATTFSTNEITTPATITLKRTGVTTAAATVLVSSANGTASTPSDYTFTPVTVSWAAGDSANKTVNVTIVDDRVQEVTETVVFSLSNATGGDTIGADSTTTLSILDYEQGTLQFSNATFSVAENAGTASITVSRTNGSDGAVTVNYATVNGTAVAPAAFTATNGTLSFAQGDLSKTISVSIIDNTLGQSNKVFTVNLSAVTGGAVLGTQISTTVTIVNDDVDFTAGLTKITPVVANITQGEVISLAQNSPFNSTNTILATINRIPELTITSLVAAQSGTTGIMEIPVGDTSFHILPYTAGQASTTTPAIFLNQDQSGRMITDEGLQINFQPAMANTTVLQTTLASMSLPKMVITSNGNLTVQSNQGPPPLDIDSSGKLVINNSFYDRYNLRPSISSSLLAPGAQQGVYLHPHPNPALPNEVFMQVVYPSGSNLRQQLFTTAPVIGSEYINALLALNGVSNVRFEPYGISAFDFNGRTLRMYADFIVRRVNPNSYSGASPQTGLFGVADLNGDKTQDFKMVFSNGDEQYFYLLP